MRQGLCKHEMVGKCPQCDFVIGHDSWSEEKVLKSFIKNKLKKKGKPTDDNTVNFVYDKVTDGGKSTGVTRVTDPELIKELDNKLMEQLNNPSGE